MDFRADDVEYQRHGDQPLLARLYQPIGPGPFPAVLEVHGGAWTGGDRFNNVSIAEALAADGIVVLSIDFRMPPVARVSGHHRRRQSRHSLAEGERGKVQQPGRSGGRSGHVIRRAHAAVERVASE